MALKVGDRVKQTTTTTGTGTITLNGAAPTGFSLFRTYLADGDTTYYVIEDGDNYEIGLGTFNIGTSPDDGTSDTIARSSDANVFRSTSSNNRVNWSSGTRSVFISLPSDKAIFRDADGDVVIPDGAFDFDVASHDGTNGLKLGGTLVTSSATELNILDGKSFVDEDNMASNSATGIASQQSIKAYVDSQVTAQDLDFQGDTGGALSIDLDSETLDIEGGTGIDTSGSSNTLTVAIDSTVRTLSGTQTLTNKTLTSPKINEDVVLTSTATELNLLDGVSGLVQADFTKLAAIDASSGELNLLDGNTSIGTTTISDGHGIVMNHGGTMAQTTVQTLAAYLDDEITAMPNLTSVGTLTSLTVDDVVIDGKVITMTGSTSDTATITVGTNGTLDIVTTDNSAAAANIQITADGTAELAGTTVTLDSSGGITLDADGGTITFADAGASLGTITSDGYTGNVVGNVSGTAATVTGAAQTNITSLGTLTTLTVDDVTINGKVITLTGSTDDTATITVGTNGTLDIVTTDNSAAAANIQITADGTAELAGTTVTLDSSGGITLDADGGTITFSDAGVSLGTITSSGYSGTAAAVAADNISTGDAAVTLATSSGNITIDAQGNDTDIIFKGTDNTADITMLTLDGSEAGDATLNGNLGVGTTPNSNYLDTGWNAIDLETKGGLIAYGGNSGTTGETLIATNAYHNGTNWKAKTTGESSGYSAKQDGNHTFYGTVGTSVSADANVTFSELFNISSAGTIRFPGNIELGHASDTTIARSSAGVVTIEGNTIATREQLRGDATNGVGVLSDEIIKRKIHIGPTVSKTVSSDTTVGLVAGRPHGGFFSQLTVSQNQVYFMPIFIPGEGAGDTTNVASFRCVTGFSGTINNNTVKMGLYSLNKFGYPSQLISKSSISSGTSTSTALTATPDVTELTPGRYAFALGCAGGSVLIRANFNSTSAGGSFYTDGFSDTLTSTNSRALRRNSTLSSDELPTDLSSTTDYLDNASCPFMAIILGENYAGE